MDDLISRQALLDWIKEYGNDVIKRNQSGSIMFVWKHVKDMPSVHPERKKGHWIKLQGRFNRPYKCSLCDNGLDFNGVNAGRGNANFCPNCGADMRGDSNE